MRSLSLTVLAALALACGGSGDRGGPGGGGSGNLVLTGTLPAGATFAGPGPSRRAVSTAAVAQVLVLSSGGGWWTAPVTDGAFSVSVDADLPVGLVFAGAGDEYLGYLRLPSGFGAIPLQAKAEGVATIGLGTLLASGEVVEAGHDPVGAEITLSASDQAALLQAEGLFAALVRNPDADGDGRVDLLEGRWYRPFITYFVQGGTFGDALVPAVSTPAALQGYRFSVGVGGDSSYPGSVTFTGPTGSQLQGQASDQPPNVNAYGATYGSPYCENPAIPPAGIYQVGYGARTLTFEMPDQSAATAHVALAVPTVTLNDDGTIHALAWAWRLGDDSGAVAPQALVDDLIVQIDADGTAPVCAANGGVSQAQGTRVYNSANLSADVAGQVLECQDIPWSKVWRIYMAYNDVYGGHVVVTWSR